MKKILLVGNTRYTILNFRGELVGELEKRGHLVKIVCPVGIDLDGSRVEKEQVIPLYLSRQGINPRQDLKTVFQLLRIFWREKPDIVLNFTIKPVIYGSLVAGLFTRAKVYSNMTGLGYLFTETSAKARLVRRVAMSLYKIALALNEKVFFQNPDDVELFCRFNMVAKDKVQRLNGSGINLEKFAPSVAAGKEPQSFIFVGRLLKDKGLVELIEAMRIVKREFPQAICRVIGEGDQNPNSFSSQQIAAWEKEGVVHFLGRINDVKPYLATSQVMVLPSYREGTPRSVLEAMASGLPIITTDAPGCRETVLPGRNGFLVPVRDHQILAERMIYFLKNPQSIQSMGEASVALARSKFDVVRVNQEILRAIGLAEPSEQALSTTLS